MVVVAELNDKELEQMFLMHHFVFRLVDLLTCLSPLLSATFISAVL